MKTITLTQKEIETLVDYLVDSRNCLNNDLQDGDYDDNLDRKEQVIDDVHNIESFLKKVK